LDLEACVEELVGGSPRRSALDDESDAPLPPAYGDDWLVLMVCDPAWAHAYWDISAARVNQAVASLDGGTAFLRLLGVPDGILMAEYQVSPQRGDWRLALPQTDRDYVAELAILHYGGKALLARSRIVHAPSTVPSPSRAPVFVTRAQQRRALATGLPLECVGEAADPSATRSARPWATMNWPLSLLSAASMGSEPRLLAIESRLP